MKRWIAGILCAGLLTSAAAAAGDPEALGAPAADAVWEVEPPAAPAGTQVVAADVASLPAYPANMEVLLNGSPVKPVGYNINGNNYYKLRDIASLLSGTPCQFNVTWDESRRAINLLAGQTYVPAGGELGAQPTEQQTARSTREAMYLNGAAVSLTAYNVQGNNYFKLVDIGQALGFQVGYDAQTRTVLMNTPTPTPVPPSDPETSEPDKDDSQTETPETPEVPEQPVTPQPDPTACIDGELKIWIDAGHGGSDSGNSSAAVQEFDAPWGVHYQAGDPLREKDFNLAVAQMLQEMLEDEGVTVRMTRTDDTTVTANERKALFTSEGGGYDMIFSVHHNGYSNATPKGAEILIQIAYENGGRGQEFGELLKQEYLDMGQTFRRFVFSHSTSDATKDYYFVLRSAQEGGALAFISEFCFMSNPEDQLWLLSEDNLRAEAQAQFDAIMEYFETHEY